jgi:lysophospholipase L1-like esterase
MPTVLALGDSLTVGKGGPIPYTTALAAQLGDAWTVVNAGRNGDWAVHLWIRFQADILPNPAPDYLVVLGGVNDLTVNVHFDDTIKNLTALYRVAHEHGSRVVALTVLPAGSSPGWPVTWDANLKKLNAWIRSQPEGVDVVVDTYRMLGDPVDAWRLRPDYDSGDGVHLNNRGYEVLGRTVYAGVDWS